VGAPAQAGQGISVKLSRPQVIGIVVASGLALGGIVAWRQPRASIAKRLIPRWPWLSAPNLAGFDEEESDEPEPEGIVYDDEGPCRTQPTPWAVPVAVSSAGPGPKVGEEFCVPPSDLEPRSKTDVTFAEGGVRPKWPLATKDDHKLKVSYEDVRGKWHGKWGRHMGASRTSTDEHGNKYKRVHVGVDLFADPGDVVLAPEDGTVIATLPFYRGTGALYLRTDSGIVVNLGEIEEGSWRKFGIGTGDLESKGGHRVAAGQPVAKVGRSNDGSHMLHVETYDNAATVDEIRHKKMRWLAGDDPPEKVLDPTRYLVRAQRVRYEEIESEKQT
jgi:murein DD-endopeptidase MepM/ murein hydrolase activator NlpD